MRPLVKLPVCGDNVRARTIAVTIVRRVRRSIEGIC
jgi:hypothetical protein